MSESEDVYRTETGAEAMVSDFRRGWAPRRLLLAAVAVLVGCTALTQPGSPSQGAVRPVRPTLTATPRSLPGLGGPASSAAAIAGRFVVGSATLPDGRAEHAVVWTLGARPSVRDLGTLGGASSRAVDIDGTVVVGVADTADGGNHAFAVDLSASVPVMRDLGALGGRYSEATAVDGSIVTGSSYVSADASGPLHAFAVDLAAPAPAMRDLGTLGGSDSHGIGAVGRTVFGTSLLAGGPQHAFGFDLTTGTMRDLGTLGGERSWVAGVAGSTVVGTAARTDGSWHAFAYRPADPAPAMQDLGALDGSSSIADAVGGSVVAGHAVAAGGANHAFAVDLAASVPALLDLGSLGGPSIGARAVDAGVVVGNGQRAGDHESRGWAFDTTAPWLRIAALDSRPGRETSVADLEGRVAVGSVVDARHQPHAMTWTLRRTTAPSLRFSGFHYAVREDAGRALVTVVRRGDPTRTASVRYRATAHSATRTDFGAVSGLLTFRSGQTRKTLAVPIRNEGRAEPSETVALTLYSAGRGAVLGTPNAAGLTIRPSDQRPDEWISTEAEVGYVGNDVINSTGSGQTRYVRARAGQTSVFHVRLYNDGNVTNTLVVRGGTPRSAGARFSDSGSDVSRALRSSAGWAARLGAHRFRAITVEVTPRSGAPVGTVIAVPVSATWRGDGTRTDVVRAVTRVVR